MNNYLGYEIEIKQDEFPLNPRKDYDNLGTLVTAHRNYSGDEELSRYCESIDEAFEEHLEGEGLTLDKVYYHKVWLYEHSGVTISTSPFGDRCDSGTLGFIYISFKKIKEEELIVAQDKTMEETVLEYLDNEIKTLDKYYTGDIYEAHIPLLDYHMGGYESEEEALADAKDMINSYDPQGKNMKMAEDLYTKTMDKFWDNINEQTLSDGDTDERQREFVIKIIGDKLRNY